VDEGIETEILGQTQNYSQTRFPISQFRIFNDERENLFLIGELISNN